ncbi:methyl-accepting chemotaxis protein [Bdellovibrio sp. HCB2-146]|uniref:methyl-accepting chemotaxis protein n=1 Tax=Bdellovibrio sp. HCB2-146 TaxID=3394362 RepID=UPI0039BC80C9
MQRELSLKAKIALPILSITAIALGLLTYFSASSSFKTAEEDADVKLMKSAEAFANAIKADLDTQLMVAIQLKAYLSSTRQNGGHDRHKVNEVLKTMLMQVPGVFGTWATYEVNAFDGKDAEYFKTPGYEKTGGFGPYWHRSVNDDGISWENSTSYDGEFYLAPKRAGKAVLTEPYYDTVDGKKLFMSSAAIPDFKKDGTLAGVVGIDILLDDLVKKISEVKPFSTSQAYLVSSRFNYVTNPEASMVGKPVVLSFAEEEFKKALSEGRALLQKGFDENLKAEALTIIVPVKIAMSGENWAVLITTPMATVRAGAYNLLIKQLCIFAACLIVMCLAVFTVSRRIATRFTHLTQKLEQAESVVTGAIDQLSRAGKNLAQSSTESAASIEETVASLEEMSSMVKLSASHAKEAAVLSGSSSKSAEVGNVEMSALLGAMGEISDSSKKIADITGVIDDLAFQTNLLALNASVEAARAGEHGKGFAVVADAVRSLAQKSAEAAKDITSLISDSVDRVERGSDKAGSSSRNLNEIVSSIKKVSSLNGEISAASDEQSTGIQQISKAMNQLDQSIQTNAAAAEEISATVQEILNQAIVMKSAVSEMNKVVRGG